eukprot:355781-Chlamydomonas_euryale.AAC.3
MDAHNWPSTGDMLSFLPCATVAPLRLAALITGIPFMGPLPVSLALTDCGARHDVPNPNTLF